jgi:hypothetical protein
MARRRSGPSSSLDLLLDTICNTFGGVVFIAILVIVLLQMTGSTQLDAPPAEDEQEELVAREARRDEVAARLKSLREAAAQQQQLFGQIAHPDDQALATQLDDLRSRRDRLDENRMKATGEISQAQIKINEVASNLASLEQSMEDAPTKVAALEAALKNELAKRTQETRLPIQRDTDKREIPLLLRAGRLHRVYLIQSDGSIVFNSAECAIRTSAGSQEVEAIPGTGVEVEDNDESRAALAERLQGMESEGDYVAVFAWPDAFGQFRLLKELLVSRHFEYRLVPMAADEKVHRGAPSGPKPKVQ